MFSNLIATSEQLSILKAVLDEYCGMHGLETEAQRCAVARELIDLLGQGVEDPDVLHARLGLSLGRPVAA